MRDKTLTDLRKTERLEILLDRAMFRALERQASLKRMSNAAFVRQILLAELERYDPELRGAR